MSVFVANRLKIAKKTITVYDMVDFKELHRGTKICPPHPFWRTIWGQSCEKTMKTGRKYGEKEKMQILIKSLIFRTLQIYIFSFYAFLFPYLIKSSFIIHIGIGALPLVSFQILISNPAIQAFLFVTIFLF